MLLQDGEVCPSITHSSITHPSTVHPQIPSCCSSGAVPVLSIPAAPLPPSTGPEQSVSSCTAHTSVSYHGAARLCAQLFQCAAPTVLGNSKAAAWVGASVCSRCSCGPPKPHVMLQLMVPGGDVAHAALSPRDAHCGCPGLVPPCSPAATWDGVFSPWRACSGEGKGKIRPLALGKPNELHSGFQTLVTHVIPPCFLH